MALVLCRLRHSQAALDQNASAQDELEPLSSDENETLWYLIRDLKNQ